MRTFFALLTIGLIWQFVLVVVLVYESGARCAGRS